MATRTILNLRIEIENAAFHDDPSQLQAIFNKMSREAYEIQQMALADTEYGDPLADAYGNTIGYWRIEEEQL